MSAARQHPDTCGVCTGYKVPAEYVALADSHYSHHGNGLTYNLLAAVLPVALAEVTAERDQFRDSALMYSAMVADRNTERDRLLVALRSAHCALYEGNAPEMALDIIGDALNGQQDGDGR